MPLKEKITSVSFWYYFTFPTYLLIFNRQTLSAESMVERKEEEKLVNHLITSAKRRDHAIAAKTKEKILNILTNKHGAWGEPTNK